MLIPRAPLIFFVNVFFPAAHIHWRSCFCLNPSPCFCYTAKSYGVNLLTVYLILLASSAEVLDINARGTFNRLYSSIGPRVKERLRLVWTMALSIVVELVWSAGTYCSSVHNVMTWTELIHTVKCASTCISSLISSIGQPFWSLSVSSHLCLASAPHYRSAPHYGACHWEWSEILLHVWKDEAEWARNQNFPAILTGSTSGVFCLAVGGEKSSIAIMQILFDCFRRKQV